MAKIKNIGSAIRNRKGLLLIIVSVCAIGVAAIYSKRQNIDWDHQIAALYEWLYFDPKKKKTIAASAPDPRPSSKEEPVFDVAFADPQGKLVTAGRGLPGWVIRLSSNGAMLGETSVSPRGEWVLEPQEALPLGNHVLSLLAIEPHSQRTIIGLKAMVLLVKQRPLDPTQPARPRAIAGVPSEEIK